MFDIGFTEILLVGIVALVVVGPERLPSLIRTALSYIRQFKTSFNNIKTEVERELELDDLKSDFSESKNNITQAVGYDDLKESLDDIKHEANDIKDIGTSEFNVKSMFEEVTDAEIEADLAHLSDYGPNLPKPDSEENTGVEGEIVSTKDNNKTNA